MTLNIAFVASTWCLISGGYFEAANGIDISADVRAVCEHADVAEVAVSADVLSAGASTSTRVEFTPLQFDIVPFP